MPVKRTEEWQIPTEWGVSTMVVEVHEDEAVLVARHFFEELGISTEDGVEDVDSAREMFVLRVPYSKAAQRLREAGFTRVYHAEEVS